MRFKLLADTNRKRSGIGAWIELNLQIYHFTRRHRPCDFEVTSVSASVIWWEMGLAWIIEISVSVVASAWLEGIGFCFGCREFEVNALAGSVDNSRKRFAACYDICFLEWTTLKRSKIFFLRHPFSIECMCCFRIIRTAYGISGKLRVVIPTTKIPTIFYRRRKSKRSVRSHRFYFSTTICVEIIRIFFTGITPYNRAVWGIPRWIPSAWLTCRLAVDCKPTATRERIIANACDAIWDYNARKAVAILERTTANACNAIRYGYACKPTATIERIIADACDAIGDYNARKAGAISERITTNASNTIRYGYAGKPTATIERIITNTCNTIGDSNTCKAWAIIERFITNTCNAIWDSNTLKARAIIERITTNACSACNYNSF